jgi:HSP20 family protein
MNRNPYIRNVSAALILGSIIAITPSSFAAEPANRPKGWGEFSDTIGRMQEQMSKIFRDTLNKKDGNTSAYAASVDVREQTDNYTVRLYLPERDVSKVRVTLEERTLKIAGDHDYEQSIVLRRAKSGATIDVKRQEHMLVVTVPKGANDLAADSKPLLSRSPLLQPDKWERDVLTRMDHMRREMDRAFESAFKDLGLDPKGFFDKSEFGSSFDLQDEKDRYVVRAYLPGRDTEAVKVTIEGQTLKIAAKAETLKRDESKSGIAESLNLSNYVQTLALPGPVDGEKMKVDRKEGLLVITLPKKGS